MVTKKNTQKYRKKTPAVENMVCAVGKERNTLFENRMDV
jgi:hypothetical protein